MTAVMTSHDTDLWNTLARAFSSCYVRFHPFHLQRKCKLITFFVEINSRLLAGESEDKPLLVHRGDREYHEVHVYIRGIFAE